MSTQTAVGRPRGVRIIAALQAAGGVLSLAGGTAGMVAAGSAPRILGPMQPYLPAIGAALIFFGAVSLVVSMGLWRGLAWAWTIAITVETLHGLGDIGSLAARGFAADKLISLAVATGLLYYLTRPGVRAYFGKPRTSRPTA